MIRKTLLALSLCAALNGCAYTTVTNNMPDGVESKEFVAPRQNNLAILLIDMQDMFMEDIDPEELNEEMQYQLAVIDYAKEHNVPVVVLEYFGHEETTSVLRKAVDGLENVITFTKWRDDGFEDKDVLTNKGLAEYLHGQGVKTLILMGVKASACVRSTGEGALDNGFGIMTSKQLIADPPYWNYEESLFWFRENGIYRDDYKDLLELVK